jgi:hypothetical protein
MVIDGECAFVVLIDESVRGWWCENDDAEANLKGKCTR